MFKELYYKKNDEEIFKFEGKTVFRNDRELIELIIYPLDGTLFANHLLSTDSVEIICVLHDGQKLQFHMIVTTEDLVRYKLLSDGKPVPWEGNI